MTLRRVRTNPPIQKVAEFMAKNMNITVPEVINFTQELEMSKNTPSIDLTFYS